MSGLWLYAAMDGIGLRNYRGKILAMACLGTHLPLLVLAGYFANHMTAGWRTTVIILAVALVATLLGTGITLIALNHLLRPVLLTARTLRDYRLAREVGVLPRHFGDDAGTLMADATETLAQLEALRDALTYLDATTKLPNRRKLEADLARRAVLPGGFAVCALRFIEYVRLLDTLDLRAAETAAQEIAQRLQTAPGGGVLYRVAGADFAMLLASEPDPADAAADAGVTLRRLIAAAAGAIVTESIAIEPVVRAGVAVWPGDASDPVALIDHAVAAVPAADGPAAEGPTIGYHAPATRRAAAARQRLETELRRALAREEFVLHYQPVVDLAVGRAVGVEALIRWQHPTRGLLPPGAFIPLAEMSGLIEPIGLWAIRAACRQVRDWTLAGLPGLTVAVNLSARQFRDPDLIGHVDAALREAGVPAGQLEIELTETAATADHNHARAVFGRLRALGVGIAIDDFGTGFASLSSLRQLPFDKLKIDREFVAGVQATRDNQAICRALMALARGLGVAVLAEGTETPVEVAWLRAQGCRLFQGDYFARPLPPHELPAGLRAVPQMAEAARGGAAAAAFGAAVPAA